MLTPRRPAYRPVAQPAEQAPSLLGAQQAEQPASRLGPGEWVLVLTPPLALAALEVFHPQPEQSVSALLDVATWFTVFHVVQLALIGLVGLSVRLLTRVVGGVHTWSLRLGLGLFLVFFSAYDTLAGIGTGLAMHSARGVSAAEAQSVFAVVEDWPGLSPVFALSILGTGGWVLSVGAVALAARRRHLPRGTWVLLLLAAVLLMGGHPFPRGDPRLRLSLRGRVVAALERHEQAPDADERASRPAIGTSGGRRIWGLACPAGLRSRVTSATDTPVDRQPR